MADPTVADVSASTPATPKAVLTTPPLEAPAKVSSTISLAHLDAILNVLLGVVDPSGTKVHKAASFIVDALGVLGTLVGIFNHQWGIDLSTAPQAVLIAVSAVIVLAMNAYRLYSNQKVATARVTARAAAISHLVIDAFVEAPEKA